MKKLTLNKKTITNLNNEDLNNVIGGKTAQSCVGNLCISDNNGCGNGGGEDKISHVCGLSITCPMACN